MKRTPLRRTTRLKAGTKRLKVRRRSFERKYGVDLLAHAQHLATVYAGLPKEET